MVEDDDGARGDDDGESQRTDGCRQENGCVEMPSALYKIDSVLRRIRKFPTLVRLLIVMTICWWKILLQSYI